MSGGVQLAQHGLSIALHLSPARIRRRVPAVAPRIPLPTPGPLRELSHEWPQPWRSRALAAPSEAAALTLGGGCISLQPQHATPVAVSCRASHGTGPLVSM